MHILYMKLSSNESGLSLPEFRLHQPEAAQNTVAKYRVFLAHAGDAATDGTRILTHAKQRLNSRALDEQVRLHPSCFARSTSAQNCCEKGDQWALGGKRHSQRPLLLKSDSIATAVTS